jgi:hypothetical protein
MHRTINRARDSKAVGKAAMKIRRTETRPSFPAAATRQPPNKLPSAKIVTAKPPRRALNATVKQVWLEHLRSGKYIQDAGHLRTDEGFCCLGVLCEAAQVPSVHNKWAKAYSYDGLDTYLSAPLRKRFGLTKPQMDRLAKMNDMGTSFAAIADYIEKKL